MFNQTFRALKYHLSHLNVMLGKLIKGRVDDFAILQAPLHIRHFFRSLVHEKHDELCLRIVGLDGVGYLLKEDGLASLRRSNDQSSLAHAYRRDEVDQPRG